MYEQNAVNCYKVRPVEKGKVLPYSLPSVGPGADPDVQAVGPQVTFLSLPAAIPARPAVTFLLKILPLSYYYYIPSRRTSLSFDQ